jgi:hypothetical protein
MSFVSLRAFSRALDVPRCGSKLDAEFVGMARLRLIRRQRTPLSTSWFGQASAILANFAE